MKENRPRRNKLNEIKEKFPGINKREQALMNHKQKKMKHE
jgi:hypothetical protein